MSPGKKKSSPSLRIFLLVSLVFLAMFLPLGAWMYTKQQGENKRLALTKKLEMLGELTTVTQRYRSVFYVREKKNFIQDKSLLFTADFNVYAGVDLAEGFDLQLKGKKARLILPHGQIFLVDADDATIHQILIKERFSSIDTGDFLPLISEEGEKIRLQVLEQDIAGEAEERAASLLKGILRSAGLEDISILFRSEGPGSGQAARGAESS
ncbi:DUF4230 domain-containing protein [Oceanispirochaeta sp.]|uniref:DUF4230 domain-containing protein n=1 Tax=Oceanispirochaeta sp. TaxID=2035350 RepID=UPI00261044E7|nr:DUF4230 domain-containing protein [Oceanispirochaeta sp.]MDA3957389.1 DUF4230 domain-containing protein [Oceanispirochaeta sp.]